jgi:glutamate dehydrogenase
MLAEAYGGRTSAFYPSFGDGPLARVHLIIGLSPGHPEPDEDSLDLQMRQLFETWEDALGRVARSTNSDQSLLSRAQFGVAYKENFQPKKVLPTFWPSAAWRPARRCAPACGARISRPASAA